MPQRTAREPAHAHHQKPTIGVNATEEVLPETQPLEAGDDLDLITGLENHLAITLDKPGHGDVLTEGHKTIWRALQWLQGKDSGLGRGLARWVRAGPQHTLLT